MINCHGINHPPLYTTRLYRAFHKWWYTPSSLDVFFHGKSPLIFSRLPPWNPPMASTRWVHRGARFHPRTTWTVRKPGMTEPAPGPCHPGQRVTVPDYQRNQRESGGYPLWIPKIHNPTGNLTTSHWNEGDHTRCCSKLRSWFMRKLTRLLGTIGKFIYSLSIATWVSKPTCEWRAAACMNLVNPMT